MLLTFYRGNCSIWVRNRCFRWGGIYSQILWKVDKDEWTYLRRDVGRRAQSTKRGSRKLLGHHWGLWEVRGPRPRHCDRAQGLGPRDSPHTSLYTFSAPSSPPSEISRSMCLSLLSPLRLLSFSLALCASPVLDTEQAPGLLEPLSAGVPVLHVQWYSALDVQYSMWSRATASAEVPITCTSLLDAALLQRT